MNKRLNKQKILEINTENLIRIWTFIENSELNHKLDQLIKNASYGDWYWQLPQDVQEAFLEAACDIREIRFMLIRALGFKPCSKEALNFV